MRYLPLPNEFHTENRRKFAQSVGPEAIAIIDTADVLRRAGDFEYPFRPDSNFYYLTGIDESEAVLILAPGHPNERLREVLFLRETSEFIATWAGARLDQATATERSGIRTIFWLDEFDDILDRLLHEFSTVYLNADFSVESGPWGPSARRAASLRRRLPLHQLKSCIDILGNQRIIKDPAEVTQIRRAIEITGAGLQKAWAALAPGQPEYALEAELSGEFIRRGATGQAFTPIVATGKNTTVIHSMPNSTEIKPTDLVLFDVGAEAGYYNADISRTLPAGGTFSERQRAVYEAVYRTQQAGIALHKPGTTILEIDEAMRRLLLKETVALGLIKPAQAKAKDAAQHLRKYYAHISHHLGLDVHDTGSFRTPLALGMVVTCEPGLYLAEEGIGVRLEDDILITETGCEVLSAGIPSAPDDIEALMQGRAS